MYVVVAAIDIAECVLAALSRHECSVINNKQSIDMSIWHGLLIYFNSAYEFPILGLQ